MAAKIWVAPILRRLHYINASFLLVCSIPFWIGTTKSQYASELFLIEFWIKFNISVETTFRILSQCIVLCCYPFHLVAWEMHAPISAAELVLYFGSKRQKSFLAYRLQKGMEGRRKTFMSLQLGTQGKHHCTLLRMTDRINGSLISP